MKNLTTNQSRVNDKTRLLLKFNYTSSLLSLLFGFFCFYPLGITKIIPYIFIGYFVLNLINVMAFKNHKNLIRMALITSGLSLVSTLVITLFSGGINSPFIFVLAIIVLAGYISTSVFGKIYFNVIVILIIGIYCLPYANFKLIYNAIPNTSEALFSLLSILFSVYLLGAIFGRNLLKAHHKLYKSKAEIEQRINEKETLLREVHHRVKNNLQTVSSLLSLQARNTKSKQFRKLIKSSQNRVISMAMIHEMLYMHDNISKIEYKSYVKELGNYLIRSLKGSDSQVQLHLDITNVELGIDTAVPLGLLINEAITNSLKYGFEEGVPGQIFVSLKQEEANNYVLTIGDNGIGFQEDVDLTTNKSLGLKLIHKLARQLAGSVIKDTSKKGTHYVIKFKDISQQFKTVAA